MRKQRRFSIEFKRQVVEELLSGTLRPAQLCRRYDISSGLLHHWKRQYRRGRFDNEPTSEAAMAERIRSLEQMVGRLTMENEFLKRVLRSALDRAEKKRGFLAQHQFLIQSIRRGCGLMTLPRSSYYYKPKGRSLAELKQEVDLRDLIEGIVLEFPRYGYRRVTRTLQRQGLRVNHKRVLRIMRQKDLLCRARRRWVKTTDSDHPYAVFPNLVRNLVTTSIDQVWLADITYIRILTTFVYLAVILDMHSRRVLGYAVSSRVDTELTLRALRMALTERKPPWGCIHHSDQGVQYAAHQYVDLLSENGFKISMSRKGNPFDNAMVESFFKTLKAEEVSLWEYQTLADVEKRIPYFIEEVYNQKRLHSSIGYVPPNEYEEKFMKNQIPIKPSQITLTQSVQT